MSEFRLWLLIVLAVGLSIFAVQNGSLSLPLVFLNMQSVTLPLSVWMLLSLAAGVLTSFLISGTFKLSNYLLTQELSAKRRRYPPQMPNEPKAVQSPNTTLQSNWGAQAVGNTTSYPSARSSAYEVRDRPVADRIREDDSAEPRNNYSEPIRPKTAAEISDDDEPVRPKAVAEDRENYDELTDDDDSFYEEWEEEEAVDSTDTSPTIKKDPTTYEVPQEPKTISHSGTIYSIGYRDPNETAVGKNESVYDADYRVINSPNPPPVKESAPDEDDWGKKEKKKQDW